MSGVGKPTAGDKSLGSAGRLHLLVGVNECVCTVLGTGHGARHPRGDEHSSKVSANLVIGCVLEVGWEQFVQARLGTLGTLHRDGSLLLLLLEPFTSHVVFALLVGQIGLGRVGAPRLALVVLDLRAQPRASSDDRGNGSEAKCGNGDDHGLCLRPW